MRALRLLYLLLLILIAPTHAAPTLSSTIRSSLPRKLAALTPGKSTPADARRVLGKPGRAEGKSLFYNLSGRKFDTTLTFENEKLRSILHSPWPRKTRLAALIPLIPVERILEAKERMHNSPEDHDQGRTFDVILSDQGLRLQFENSPEERLSTLVVWNPGSEP